MNLPHRKARLQDSGLKRFSPTVSCAAESFRDEYGGYLCPLNALQEHWDDTGTEMISRCEVAPCRAPLYIDEGRTHSLDAGISAPLTTSWEVVCEEGHHLLTSGTAEDYSQPFDLELALKAIYQAVDA